MSFDTFSCRVFANAALELPPPQHVVRAEPKGFRVASFALPNPTAHTFPVGTTFTLTVANGAGNTITIYPNGNGVAGNNSRIEFNATTVIGVPMPFR